MKEFQNLFSIEEGAVEDINSDIKDQIASIAKLEKTLKNESDAEKKEQLKTEIKQEKDTLNQLKKDLQSEKKSEREEDSGIKSSEDVGLAITDVQSELQKTSDPKEKKKLQDRLTKLQAKQEKIKKGEHEKKAKESDVLGKAGEALKSGDLYDRLFGALAAGGMELFKKKYNEIKAKEGDSKANELLSKIIKEKKKKNDTAEKELENDNPEGAKEALKGDDPKKEDTPEEGEKEKPKEET